MAPLRFRESCRRSRAEDCGFSLSFACVRARRLLLPPQQDLLPGALANPHQDDCFVGGSTQQPRPGPLGRTSLPSRLQTSENRFTEAETRWKEVIDELTRKIWWLWWESLRESSTDRDSALPASQVQPLEEKGSRVGIGVPVCIFRNPGFGSTRTGHSKEGIQEA